MILRENFDKWLKEEYPGIVEGFSDDPEGEMSLAWEAFQAGYKHDREQQQRIARDVLEQSINPTCAVPRPFVD